MVYNELEQGDILSEVRLRLATRAYTDISLRSISWVRFLEACFGFFRGVIVAAMSDYRHKRHNVSVLI